MPLNKDDYRILGRAECLGVRRRDYEAEWNEKYTGWQYGFMVWVEDEASQTEIKLLDLGEILEYYVQAYVIAFQAAPQLFHSLAEQALDVFEVDAGIDPLSGENFTIQRSNATHFIDIAIRRVFKTYGLEFKGSRLVNLNKGGDKAPDGREWFEHLSPSLLSAEPKVRPATKGVPYLTDPCDSEWFGDEDHLTIEKLYQQARVVMVHR